MYRMGTEIRATDTNRVLGRFSDDAAAAKAFDMMMPKGIGRELNGNDLLEFKKMQKIVMEEFEGNIFC